MHHSSLEHRCQASPNGALRSMQLELLYRAHYDLIFLAIIDSATDWTLLGCETIGCKHMAAVAAFEALYR